MNKRGQFFLVATVIIVAILLSIVNVQNSIKVSEEDLTVYDLSNELNLEGSQVIISGILRDLSEEQIKENLTTLINHYSQTNPEKDIVAIYGDSEATKFEGGGIEFTCEEFEGLKIKYKILEDKSLIIFKKQFEIIKEDKEEIVEEVQNQMYKISFEKIKESIEKDDFDDFERDSIKIRLLKEDDNQNIEVELNFNTTETDPEKIPGVIFEKIKLDKEQIRIHLIEGDNDFCKRIKKEILKEKINKRKNHGGKDIIEVILSDSEKYDFEILQGQRFFIIIKKEKDGEIFVARTGDEKNNERVITEKEEPSLISKFTKFGK